MLKFNDQLSYSSLYLLGVLNSHGFTVPLVGINNYQARVNANY